MEITNLPKWTQAVKTYIKISIQRDFFFFHFSLYIGVPIEGGNFGSFVPTKINPQNEQEEENIIKSM